MPKASPKKDWLFYVKMKHFKHVLRKTSINK